MVGSSNLTPNGLKDNRELSITVESHIPLYEDINKFFLELWNEAKNLTKERFKATPTLINYLQEDDH